MNNERLPAAPRGRRRPELTRAIRDSLRELTSQMALLNQRVGDRLELKPGDLQCLELIDRLGPVSPGALARRAGIHPATLTGIIDRLERGGWVVRDRGSVDRRSVRVRVVSGRGGEVLRLYSGMLRRLGDVCAGLDEAELEVVAGFLRRTAEAGRSATDELAAG